MRIRRRHAAIFAVAAIGVLAAASAAFAITNNGSTATFKVTPNTGLSKTLFKNAALNLHTHTVFAQPGNKAAGGFVKTVKLYFDSDLKFNTGAAPVCNKNLANTTEKQAMALCGSSLIGRGSAQATSSMNATIPGCVIAFNGPKNGAGQPTIILHSRFVIASPCPNPSTSTAGSIDAILAGTLVPANKAGYGKALNVPNVDTQPLPLKDFVTTVSKGSYVQARCSATPLRMQAVFTYSGAGQAPDTANATQACSNVAKIRHTLTVTKSGSGTGSVTSSPAGIDCGATCSANFDEGTSVTLNAQAAAGSKFTGWSGGGCSGTAPCQVTMNADQPVKATFDAPPNTKIKQAKISQLKDKATFKFKAKGSAATGFQCQLKRKGHKSKGFKKCSSPKTYKQLKKGKYTFKVRAKGPGGKDATPAKKKFKIK